MEPERSKSLHNFSLPCLKWGAQKFLRCVNSNNNNNDPSPPNPNSSKLDSFHNNPIRRNDESVDAVRERIMGDLRVAAKKLKVSIFEENGVVGDVGNGNGNGNGGGGGCSNGVIRPWNLRTRRAACKAPAAAPSPLIPPVKEDGRRFFDVGCSSPVMMKKKKMMMVNEKVKFSVSLSKEEVEEDFWALVGTRPPRRPKKRSRIVQKQLNTLLPGMWLAEVTPDSYKVAEVPE